MLFMRLRWFQHMRVMFTLVQMMILHTMMYTENLCIGWIKTDVNVTRILFWRWWTPKQQAQSRRFIPGSIHAVTFLFFVFCGELYEPLDYFIIFLTQGPNLCGPGNVIYWFQGQGTATKICCVEILLLKYCSTDT